MTDRTIVARLRAEVGGYVREMNTAAAATKRTATEIERTNGPLGKLATNIDKNRAAWQTAGKVMLGVGAGFTVAAGLAAKAAIDWESAFTGVTKTVSGTPAQLAKVEEGLRGLARTLPASHQQIAAVAEAAGQLGISTGGVVDFTKTMIELGDTTNLSAEDAATALARIRNIMGNTEPEVERMGSTIVALGNNSATTEAEITELGTRLAAAGKQAGLSTADVFSYASALTSVGVNAEAGGTAFSKVFTTIADATRDGGDKLRTFAQVSGVSVGEFKRDFEDDAAGAIAMFVEGMGRTAKAGKSTTQIFDQLHLKDQRLMRAILSTGQAQGLLGDQLKLGNKAWAQNTALVNEANKRYDTTQAKLSIARNAISDAAIDIGEGLVPAIAKGAEGVAALANGFSKLPGPVKNATGLISGIGGVALVAAGGFAYMAPRVVDTVDAMRRLQNTAPRTAGAIGTVGKAAGIAAAAFAAYEIAQSVLGDTEAAAGAGVTAKAILELGDNSDAAAKSIDKIFTRQAGTSSWFNNASQEISGLDDALAKLQEGSLKQFASSPLLGESKYDLARESIEQYDSALSSLVQSGAEDKAAEGAAYFAEKARAAGLSTDEVKKLLPHYVDALAEADNQQRSAGDSAKGAAKDVKKMDPAAQAAAKALAEYKDEIRKTSANFVDFAKATKNGDASLKQFIHRVQKQVKAQANWGDNLVALAKRGASKELLDQLRSMGVEGATYVQKLADGSDKDLKRLDKATQKSARQADNLADRLTNLGKKHPHPKADVDGIPPALRKVDSFHDSLDNIDKQRPEPKVSVGGVKKSVHDLTPLERALVGLPPGKPEVEVQGIPKALRQVGGFKTAFERTLGSIKDEPVNINLTSTASSVVKSLKGFFNVPEHAAGGPISSTYGQPTEPFLTEGVSA